MIENANAEEQLQEEQVEIQVTEDPVESEDELETYTKSVS